MLITEVRRTGANMPRLHAVFSSGFPRALKKKMAERKRTVGDGNPSILAYFSKKAWPLPDADE